MQGLFGRIRSALAVVGAVLLALLGGFAMGRRRPPRPLAREVDKALAHTESAVRRAGDVLAEEKAKQADRRQRAAALAERLKRLPVVLLAVAVVAAAGPAAFAEEAAAPAQAAEARQLPGDYDTLAKLYLEAVQVASEYKALYEEAEASNDRLMAELEALRQEVQRLTQVVERQQQLLEQQQKAVLGILKGLRVSAGVSLQSLNPVSVAPWIGLAFAF